MTDRSSKSTPSTEKAVEDLATLYNQGSPSSLPPPSKPTGTGPSDKEEDLSSKMTFLEHLEELRKRILYSVLSLAVAFCACWFFREQIFSFLRAPIDQVVPQLVYTKVTDTFTIWLKVAFTGGVFLASPLIVTQLWLFIAPGLYRREKAYAAPFLLSATSLFLLGGAFAYYIILPTALRFLVEEFGTPFVPMLTAIDYFSFEVTILVGMGAIFQLPVVVAFLSLFGVITPGFLWRNFRYALLLIVIIAAIVSPTADALNLLLWSGPMTLLYVVSIAISWIFERRRKKHPR